MTLPVLTIVTINYNNAAGLEKTIASVKTQDYKPLEYIVIDGGSTDGSKEIIEVNASLFSYWVSEKDNGIYHAMNKGIKKATGKYLLFLNSGDYLNKPDSLSVLLAGNPDEDIIYGDLLMQGETEAWVKTHPSTLNFEYFLKETLPHPSSLIRKALFERTGLYSEHFKVVSDWEFFMNAVCRFRATYKYVAYPVSVFNLEGISSNPANDAMINKEKAAILQDQYSAFLSDYKLLDEYRYELNNIRNSRLHKIAAKIQRSLPKRPKGR